MHEPDYDKLLQQAESCRAAQPLMRDLVHAIRCLRALNAAILEANRILVAAQQKTPPERGSETTGAVAQEPPTGA